MPPRQRAGVARPAPIWWVAILAGMVLVTAAAFGPEQLPPSVAWARALGTRLFGGVTGLRVVCILAHLAHSVEAGVAWGLARRADPSNALGWAFQTFLLGYPSLTLLRSRSKRAVR